MRIQLIRGLLLLGSLGIGLFGAESPFVGAWKLNVAKSKFAAGREIEELTVTVTTEGANRVVTAKGMDGKGAATSVKYSVPSSGGVITFTEGAPPAGTTVMAKVVNDHTNDQIATRMESRSIRSIRWPAPMARH